MCQNLTVTRWVVVGLNTLFFICGVAIAGLSGWAVHHHDKLTALVPAGAVYPTLIAGVVLAMLAVLGCAGAYNPSAGWARFALYVYATVMILLAVVEFAGAGALIGTTSRLDKYNNERRFRDPAIHKLVTGEYHDCCSIHNATNATSDAFFYTQEQDAHVHQHAMEHAHAHHHAHAQDAHAYAHAHAHHHAHHHDSHRPGAHAHHHAHAQDAHAHAHAHAHSHSHSDSESHFSDTRFSAAGGRQLNSATPDHAGCWLPDASGVVTDKNCASESKFENAFIAYLLANLVPLAAITITVGLLQLAVGVTGCFAARNGWEAAKSAAEAGDDPWMHSDGVYTDMEAGAPSGGLTGFFRSMGRSGHRADDDLAGGIYD